ncbi:hypothetical protein PUN28_008588 [Cardiocondyla obscurior]|uniref:Uncharacterized protein n=1 Tax=Cardiocondyla obscurior TaxID=286306 RepID=A0AAW2FYB0_9HYME
MIHAARLRRRQDGRSSRGRRRCERGIRCAPGVRHRHRAQNTRREFARGASLFSLSLSLSPFVTPPPVPRVSFTPPFTRPFSFRSVSLSPPFFSRRASHPSSLRSSTARFRGPVPALPVLFRIATCRIRKIPGGRSK